MSDKRGAWKRLLGKLRTVAPTILDRAGDIVGGPAGLGLEALARLVAGSSGDTDIDEVADTILANPTLMVRMEELAIERERALLENETARIAQVNETMRAEAGGEDAWTRRWRPFWGFVAGVCWGILALAVAVVVLAVAFGGADPATMRVIVNLFESMTMMWTVALAVLGVTAFTRGVEKVVKAKGSATLRDISIE